MASRIKGSDQESIEREQLAAVVVHGWSWRLRGDSLVVWNDTKIVERKKRQRGKTADNRVRGFMAVAVWVRWSNGLWWVIRGGVGNMGGAW